MLQTAEHHDRECDQELGHRRVRVLVDIATLQILFSSAGEVNFVEDLTWWHPIANEQQDE
jgi:hypothetical protein